MNWEDVEKKYKTFSDPIHGYIKMNSLCLQFIDTPQFQRLRDLKQLGTLCYIFPSAVHTRFEHSIGVGHLSGSIVERYKQNQKELKLTNREVNLVKIAGLTHDLGHGPFSHIFDNVFIPKIQYKTNYNHETMSIKMLDYLIDDNNIDLEKQDINFIKQLIISAKLQSTDINYHQKYLYEIVANGYNSIDVDKFDYLSRDMHNLFGVSKSYNFQRIYEFNRVIDENICYDSKVFFDIYELFQQRYNMHRQMYHHKKNKSIEYMISDAMFYADNILNISKSIENPEDFLYLTDNIIKTIEISKNPELKKSQDIIKNIHKRHLYEFIDEYIVPLELINKIPIIEETDISTNNIVHNVNINPEDIIIYDNRLNYNKNDKNPIDNVYFYNSYDLTKKFKKNKADVSLLFPNNYEERVLRIYSRNTDYNINLAIKLAFQQYLSQFN